MMGLYALYRLLWRPGFIALYVFLAGILLSVVASLDRAFPSLPFSGRLILLTVAIPSLAGVFVGQSVGEIQHTPLSWSLPRIRWRLVSSVGFTGAVISVLTTCAYDWLGGSAPTIPILASCFLWFSLAFTTGTYEFIDVRSLRFQKSAVWFIKNLKISIFVFGVLSINRITDVYMARPALCALVAFIGAFYYLRRSFGVNAARGKSLVSMPVFHRFTFGPYQSAGLAGRRVSRRKWKRPAPLTGLIDWIRAGEYENFGTVRIGWLGSTFLCSVGILIVGAVMDRFMGQDHVFDIVFPMVSLGTSMMLTSLYVQKRWLYPLSRAQLARLAYWCSLLHNALYCGIMLLAFFLLKGLTDVFEEIDLARPIVLMFICNPVIQWMRFRNVKLKVSSYVILALFVIGYSILGPIWLNVGPSVYFIYEAATVAGLILLSQCLFRYKIEMYFKTGDLV